MKRIETTLAFWVVISIMTLEAIGYAQPNIPKEDIPSNIPYNVRKEIEGLYSSDSTERGYAAQQLGKMATLAVPAIPFLIEILGDSVAFVRGGAAEALGKIGKPAVEPLIAALKDKDRRVREKAVWALVEITGENLGQDPIKWQRWWEQNKQNY